MFVLCGFFDYWLICLCSWCSRVCNINVVCWTCGIVKFSWCPHCSVFMCINFTCQINYVLYCHKSKPATCPKIWCEYWLESVYWLPCWLSCVLCCLALSVSNWLLYFRQCRRKWYTGSVQAGNEQPATNTDQVTLRVQPERLQPRVDGCLSHPQGAVREQTCLHQVSMYVAMLKSWVDLCSVTFSWWLESHLYQLHYTVKPSDFAS